MTRQELETGLNEVIQLGNQLSTVVYAVMKETNAVKQLNIDGDELRYIQEMFLGSISENILDVPDQGIIRVSEADDRANTVFEYDMALPEDLQYLTSELNDSINTFSFRNDDLANIDSLIIEIGTEERQIRLLKKLSTVEVFGRGGYLLWKSNERLERFEDKVLRLTPKFSGVFVDDTIIFTDLKLLERSHGFHDVIVREATVGIQLLEEIDILTNTDGLIELLSSDVRFARKVLKIRNSPVIKNNIPNENIIAFTRTHPSLANKLKYSDDGTQIELQTKKAKLLFIKMLDDVFLNSELTNQFYESKAKDEVAIEEEVEEVSNAIGVEA